jgi:hypothetical protein
LHALGEVEGLASDAVAGGRVATVDDVAAGAGGDAPRVVLVVRCGRTTRGAVQRTVAILDAGATPVLGSILLCRTRSEAEGAWT